MDAEDLLNKAKSGDRQALIAWGSIYRPLLEKVAYQAGLSKKDAGKFHHAVIGKFIADPDSLEDGDAEEKLLKTAVRMLKMAEADAGPADGSLKFEEDVETHQALQNLPMQEKLAVILVHFHGKSIQETASVLEQTEAESETALVKGKTEIGRELDTVLGYGVEKRLDLLAKSYDRIEFPEEDDFIIEETLMPDPESAASKQVEKAPVKRRTIAVLAGASLFLAAVIGTSFLFNDQPAVTRQTAAEEENPTTVTRQMVKNWEAQYEEIRESAPDRLGLTPETFDQLEYVKKADELKERTFSRQNVKQLRDDPDRMQEQVDVLMLSIETPKGMLDAVRDYRLMADETGKFLWIYTDKTDQLMTIADGLLEKYQEEVAAAAINGELSPEKLMYSRGDYPEEIKKLTASLSEYTLNLSVHPNEDKFRTIRDVNRFYEIHPFNSDMQSSYYLDILRNAPFYDETGLLWPAEQLPYSVWTMVAFLGEPTVDPGLKGKVEPLLMQTFWSTVKGVDEEGVFDSSGKVKEEYRLAWEGLLQVNSNPLTFLILPVMEEFEESGWKESAHFDALALQDILYAIELESKGELAEKLPNSDLEIKSETLALEGYDYSDILPLYDKFAATLDINTLSGVSPMEIIKLYHYANRVEDIEMMWHLTADNVLKSPLEEYKKSWKKRPEITDTLRAIEIYAENTHRQGRKVSLMAMGTQKTEDMHYQQMQDFVLYTERDRIWLMQHQMDEFYTRDKNFDEFDANVKKYYASLLQNSDLSEVAEATPAEIAGIFLLAMEKSDAQTMRLLVNVSNESMSDEEFERLWITENHLPAYSEMDLLNFRVDSYNLGGQTMTGGVNVAENTSTMGDIYHFPMEKVDGYWMVLDMYGY